MVEAITGLPTERFMRERVFGPLGMSSSTTAWSSDVAARLAQGHLGLTNPVPRDNYADLGNKLSSVAEKWGKPIADWLYDDQVNAIKEAERSWPVTPNYMMPNVAGSVLTNATDVSMLMLQMMKPRSDTPIHAAELRRLMLEPVVNVNHRLSWSLGWGIERDGSDRTSGIGATMTSSGPLRLAIPSSGADWYS